jgi:uncharacterized glyoxalase superfamily protein PhnB
MSEPSFVQAVLVLPVADMKQAREWYANTLGFETVYLHDDPVDDPEGNYAILRRDGAEVHLILDEPPRTHPWTTAGTGYLFLVVRGVDAVYQHALARGITVTRGIKQESWGARAFQLTDPSGNLILVAEDTRSQA